ncbi:MAG TPA: hypothetical protein VJ998_04690 [Pseudomonadales bacterium]|nr:hypothetical protein [Pseudomonadales bacterium]
MTDRTLDDSDTVNARLQLLNNVIEALIEAEGPLPLSDLAKRITQAQGTEDSSRIAREAILLGLDKGDLVLTDNLEVELPDSTDNTNWSIDQDVAVG